MSDQLALNGFATVALRDPTAPRPAPAHLAAADTELNAARLIAPRAGTWRRIVLDVLARSEDGMTDWELHTSLGGNLYTIAPRRTELCRDGWLKDSGRRRVTNNQRAAIVWILTDVGRAQWEPAA